MRILIKSCVILFYLIYCGLTAKSQNIPKPPKDRIFAQLKGDSLKKVVFNNSSLNVISNYASKIDSVPYNQDALKLANNTISTVKSSWAKKLGGLKKSPFKAQFTIESQNRYQTSASSIDNPISTEPTGIGQPKGFISALNFIGSIQAWGIPFNFNYSTNRNLAYQPLGLNNNLFKMDFDPKQLNGLLSNDLNQYYDLKKQVFEGLDLSGYTSEQLTNKLRALKSETGVQESALQKYLGNANNLDQLLRLDDKELKEKLLQHTKENSSTIKKHSLNKICNPDSLGVDSKLSKVIKENKVIKAYLADTANLSQLDTMSEASLTKKLSTMVDTTQDISTQKDNINKLSKAINARRNSIQTNTKAQVLVDLKSQNNEVDSALTTIKDIKAELNKNGYDIEKILQMQHVLKDGNSELGDAEIVKNYLSKKPTNGIQGILSKLDALKIGSFGNKAPGSMLSRDLFISGTNVAFKTPDIGITLGYGGIKDVGSLKDASFQNSVFNTPKNISYISAEKRGGIFNNVKLSVVSSFTQQANNSLYALPTISSNNMAFTVSKALNLAYIGRLNIDVSKSSTLYKNQYSFGSESFLNRAAGLQYDASNDLFEALSFGISHRLEIKKLNLTDNVYFNYAGMGYQNPANNGFSNARMRLGGNIRKTFYKNKLAFIVKTDLKNIPISFTSNDKWQNLQMQFDTRYAFSKKFNIDLKYTTNRSAKQINHQSTPVYSLNKIQVDGNANYKIGKNYSVSHFTIGTQSYTNSYNLSNIPTASPALGSAPILPVSGASNMLLVNYIHSVLLRNNTLTATVFYNRELSPLKLIGNMLNTDLAYQYKLFKKLNLTSALTYLDNDAIARQAGIRQTVQIVAGSHFDVDTFLDLRKNLITPLYADLYAQCRAEIMLRYHIKTK